MKSGLVTGAGSGIGLATARLLAGAGFRVAMVGRDGAKLAEAARSVSGAVALPADLSKSGEAGRVVDAAMAAFGRLDVVVNNAGHAELAPIEATSVDLIRRTFSVNTEAPALIMARVWPAMVAQKSGRIVNVSSMASVDPFPGFFVYAAAKGALNLLTMAAAKEGAAHNIRAFAVAPGAVETPMLRSLFPESSLPRSRTLSPEAVARVIVECATGARDGESGRVITMASP